MMKKALIKICITLYLGLLLCSEINSQTLASLVPNNGNQGANIPVNFNGSGTFWMASPYFEVYFDSTGVYADSVVIINDSLINAKVHIDGKAPTTYRKVTIADAFFNLYSKDSAFKINLTAPAPPVLLTPPNNSINQPTTVLFKWDTNYYVVTYRLQVATDSLFNNTVFDTSGIPTFGHRMRANVLQNNVKYFWRVRGTNGIGAGLWSATWNFRVTPSVIKINSTETVSEYKLFGNYPNPFNPFTKIRYQIPENTLVTIKIFDIQGREVTVLLNEFQYIGIYEAIWNAENIAGGVYLLQFTTKNYSETSKLILIK